MTELLTPPNLDDPIACAAERIRTTVSALLAPMPPEADLTKTLNLPLTSLLGTHLVAASFSPTDPERPRLATTPPTIALPFHMLSVESNKVKPPLVLLRAVAVGSCAYVGDYHNWPEPLNELENPAGLQVLIAFLTSVTENFLHDSVNAPARR